MLSKLDSSLFRSLTAGFQITRFSRVSAAGFLMICSHPCSSSSKFSGFPIPAITAISSPIRLQQLFRVLPRRLGQLLAAQHARNFFCLLGCGEGTHKRLGPSRRLALLDQIMMVSK
jgi:hypothetical protein